MSRDFPRTMSDVLDFYPTSVSASLPQGDAMKKESVLFTYSDEANYTVDTSNLPAWISSVTGTSGEADHAGGEVDVMLDATGIAPGTYSHTLVATAPGYQNAELEIELTVTGEGQFLVAIDPVSADFGSIPLGYTASQDFTITNVGNLSGSLGDIGAFQTVGGVDYRFSGLSESLTLDPGESVVQTLSITPISGGGTVTYDGDISYSVTAETAGTLIARINAGGEGIDEPALPDWASDVHFDGGQPFQNAMVQSVDVPGGTEASMYLTERSAGANLGTFAYRIPVPGPGTYITRLHFAETFFGAPRRLDRFRGPACV